MRGETLEWLKAEKRAVGGVLFVFAAGFSGGGGGAVESHIGFSMGVRTFELDGKFWGKVED